MGHVKSYTRRDARTGRPVHVGAHRRTGLAPALDGESDLAPAVGSVDHDPFAATGHVFEPDDPTPVGPLPGDLLGDGRSVQPVPYDTHDAASGSVTVGGFLLTSHLEQRRVEMGVSRIRLLQAIVHRDSVTRQQGYSHETHYAVASFPYRLYLSEDRKRVITIVWMTDDPQYQRGTGVPPDCRDAHLATRCGLPGKKGTDGVMKLSSSPPTVPSPVPSSLPA